MSTQVQRRKGTTTQHSTFTGASAELTVDTTKNTVVVHDGATVGGFALAKEIGSVISATSLAGPLTGTVGATTANTGAFTTVSATGAVSALSFASTTGANFATTSGNLGVGTSSPGAALDVASGLIRRYQSSASASAAEGLRLEMAGNSAANRGFYMSFYSPNGGGTSREIARIAGLASGGGADSGGYLSFETVSAGTGTNAEAMRITAAGNLGIGTTSPQSRLHVSGSGNTEGIIDAPSASAILSLIANAGGGGIIAYKGASLRFGSATGYGAAGFSEQIRLDSAGNLGIGTSSPTSKLTVAALRTTSSGEFLGGINALDTTTGGAAGVGGVITLSGDTQGAGYKQFAAMLGGKENSTVTDLAGFAAFYTRPGGGNLTERMRINSAGNLGLGVTPSAWWSNSRAIELGGSATAYIAFNSPTTSAGGYFYANSFYNGTNNLYKNNGFAAQYAINPGDGSHKWYTAASGTAGATVTFTQVMTLDASGNLGIGTTSPKANLHIAAAPQATIVKISATDQASGMLALGDGNSTTNNVGIYRGAAASTANGNLLNLGGYDGIVFTTGNLALGAQTERMRLDISGNLGIGATANASAILDAQSTTKGVRMPNMTTTQKNAIASPAAGLMVFDTTLAKLCVYSGSAWQTITSI
jgi:hypothetical protein